MSRKSLKRNQWYNPNSASMLSLKLSFAENKLSTSTTPMKDHLREPYAQMPPKIVLEHAQVT